MNDDYDRIICEKCGDTIDELSAHSNGWVNRDGFDYCEKCDCPKCKVTGKVESPNADSYVMKIVSCPDCKE